MLKYLFWGLLCKISYIGLNEYNSLASLKILIRLIRYLLIRLRTFLLRLHILLKIKRKIKNSTQATHSPSLPSCLHSAPTLLSGDHKFNKRCVFVIIRNHTIAHNWSNWSNRHIHYHHQHHHHHHHHHHQGIEVFTSQDPHRPLLRVCPLLTQLDTHQLICGGTGP